MMSQIFNLRRINPDLEIAGVLPTMVYPDQSLRDSETAIRESLAAARIRVFRHIRRSVKVDQSTFAQEALIYSAPKSKATYDYKVFVRQLVGDPEGGEI